MKFLNFVICLAMVMVILPSCSPSEKSNTESKPAMGVIFDTDMGNDIDDALAIAMLYHYADAEMIDLLGIGLCKNHEYAVPFIDLYNRFYGYPEIPIGFVFGGKTNEPQVENMFLKRTLMITKDDKPLFEIQKKLDENTPEAYKLYRKILAAQADSSVVFVVVGFHTNMQRLLESGPDEYSELNGVDLVNKKVKMLSVMAGHFPSHKPEWNVAVDIPSSRFMFDNWPTEIVVSDFTIGEAIQYPSQSIVDDFENPDEHPLIISFRYHSGQKIDSGYNTKPTNKRIAVDEKGGYLLNSKSSYDLTSVLYAVEADSNYFDLSERGKVTVTEEGFTDFVADPDGKHRYLIVPSSIEGKRKIQERLVRWVTDKEEISPRVAEQLNEIAK